MKILQVTPYYPPHAGGIEFYVEALSQEFVAKGHEVTIATMSYQRGLPRSEERDGIHIVRFPRMGTEAYGFPVGLGAYLLRNARRFDIIHAHNYHALPFLVTVSVCGAQAIVNPHFHGRGHTFFANLMHLVYQPVAALLLRRARAVICNSPSEAQLVTEKLGVKAERITIIPNIVITARGRVHVTPPEPRDNDRCLLLSVGRLEAHKRIDRAIQALCDLPDHFHLAIIGDGKERANLEQMAADLGLAGRVQFLGYVTDQELHQWYDRSNLVVTFSEFESFGRVLVEALQHQRQVLCSPIPAFRDLANQFPEMITVVETGADAPAIADHIQAINLQARSARVDLEKFSPQQVAGNIMHVYVAASTD